MDRIYLEEAIRDHPRVRTILERFPASRVTLCERYTEVFNPRAQNFRLQKKRPALILAEKHGDPVWPTPPGYGIGAGRNYYFSHMLNCLYDCRYCFLQGMYPSANYVHFVNYEHFERGIDELAEREDPGDLCFFTGYDCDSLALESITGFASYFLPFFAERPELWWELRTKSLATTVLEEWKEPLPRAVVAYTLSPDAVARMFEHGAPPVARRIDRLASLARQGWQVGLRLDPLLPWPGFETVYGSLLDEVFEAVPVGSIHSVTVGTMRFPKAMFDRIRKLYPTDPLFALAELTTHGGQTGFRSEVEEELVSPVLDRLHRDLPRERVFRQK